MSYFRVVLLAVLAVVQTVSSFDYSCDFHKIVFFNTVDVTESMETTGYLDQLTGEDGVMANAMRRSRLVKPFTFGTLATFQDHNIPPMGNTSDHCFRVLQAVAVTPGGMAAHELQGSGGGDDKDGQMTALYQHANAMLPGWWKKVLILYTDSIPNTEGPVGLDPPPQIPYHDCQRFAYPTIEQVNSAVKARDAFLVVVTTPEHVGYYEGMSQQVDFPTMVTTFGSTAEDTLDKLMENINWAVCGKPTTTEAPVESTPVGCEPENFALQMMHVQDVSSSFSNDLPNMKIRLPALLQNLTDEYHSTLFSIASFSDIGQDPYGQVNVDYPYRLDAPLGSSAQFLAALNGLNILSGKDWRESQLLAMESAIGDSNVGWIPGDFDPVESVYRMRVLIVSTDAGYHDKNDGPYPTVAEVKSALEGSGIIPLFIVTDDMYNKYSDLLDELDVGGAIRPIAADSDDIAEAIGSGLHDICEQLSPTARRLRAMNSRI